ncbi:hypothetical protein [Paraburkholderia sp. J76]|uniref:hypothetical protein n=1 Tax=Paraburkholderia sp. J76 TaxID=2805439 RepID=UPI002ABE02D0|nr:hypothetical protein [Paraburkholderia sp. J76]
MKIRRIVAVVALSALAVAPAFAGQTLSEMAQGIVANTEPVRARGVVASVDYAQNRMTVIGPEGNALVAPIAVNGRLSHLPVVGDTVAVAFSDAMLVSAEAPRASGDGIRTRIDTQVAVPTPMGYSTASQVELVATVQHVDRITRAVTLRGARETITVKAGQGVDLERLKAGEEIHAVLVDAFAISLASE